MNQSYLIFIVAERNTKIRMYIHEKPNLEVSFVTPTKNSSVITNDTQVPWEYPYHLKEL